MLLTLEANVSAIVGVCPLDSTTTDRAMTSKVVHIFSVSTYYSAALPGAPPRFITTLWAHVVWRMRSTFFRFLIGSPYATPFMHAQLITAPY